MAAQSNAQLVMESKKGTKDNLQTWNAQMKMRGKTKMVFAVVYPTVRVKQE